MPTRLRGGGAAFCGGRPPPPSPPGRGRAPAERRMRAQIQVYVGACGAACERALGFGATTARPPQDMFYRDRVASVKDAWGNEWFLSTHKEDVPLAEMQKRMLAPSAG